MSTGNAAEKKAKRHVDVGTAEERGEITTGDNRMQEKCCEISWPANNVQPTL
jgi:hypothetical protein